MINHGTKKKNTRGMLEETEMQDSAETMKKGKASTATTKEKQRAGHYKTTHPIQRTGSLSKQKKGRREREAYKRTAKRTRTHIISRPRDAVKTKRHQTPTENKGRGKVWTGLQPKTKGRRLEVNNQSVKKKEDPKRVGQDPIRNGPRGVGPKNLLRGGEKEKRRTAQGNVLLPGKRES